MTPVYDWKLVAERASRYFQPAQLWVRLLATIRKINRELRRCERMEAQLRVARPCLARQHSGELVEDIGQIGLHVQHTQDRIVAKTLHPLRGILDSERLRIERVVHIVPQQG